ncbi:MAG: response regulator transcription factor [Gemmatimonadales bacterium]|nr:response regulator transcription factor [Gemmatimonadales bacterium]
MADILLVEDHRDIAEGLRACLEAEGYSVAVEYDGGGGLAAVEREGPSLIVLDLMIPPPDGFELLRRWRECGHLQPVLVLSALGTEPDKVRGFRLGADDYVTKPFGLDELLARVGALIRRHKIWRQGVPVPSMPISFAGVIVHPSSRTVSRHGEVVPLRPKEFELLLALVSRPDTVISRRALLTAVWDYSPNVESRTVDIHMVELRRKLEDDPAFPRHLLTVRKAGYVFRP